MCGGSEGDEEAWYPACQAALNVLALVCDDAPFVFEACVRKLGARATTADGAARLFYVAGHVAIKMLVHAEQLASRIKRLRAAGGTDKALAAKKADAGNAGNAEEDMVGASAEEESEDATLRRIAETELVLDPEGLLGMHLPLLLKVVTDGNAPQRLRSSAVLCLSKFMAVSEPLCERHLPLLLTVLRDAPEPAVRANIVIALGDLALRFPNAVEPFTAQVYRPLRDPTASVRKNTLMVLTHLVLNDMIKIRGEVSEIALRLEDDDQRVQDLARLFFSELAKRGTNPIYNLLPDVLGGLSREDASVLGPARFRAVAKYLLAFVEKDKQCEAIADKLCQRIHAAAGFPGEGDVVVASQLPAMQQCRDLAFCLEHLQVSETLAKRMTDDLFKLYRALLGDRDIYASITRLGKEMKGKSEQTRRAVEDWLRKVDELHAAQSEEATTVERAAKGRKKKPTAAASGAADENQLPKPAARKPAASKRKPAGDSEGEDDDEPAKAKKPAAVRCSRPPAHAPAASGTHRTHTRARARAYAQKREARKPAATAAADADNEEPVAKRAAPKRAAAAKRVTVKSDSEDEDVAIPAKTTTAVRPTP